MKLAGDNSQTSPPMPSPLPIPPVTSSTQTLPRVPSLVTQLKRWQLSVADLLVPEESKHLQEFFTGLEANKVHRGEWQSRRKDGSRFPAEVSLVLLYNGKILGIGRDISERKKQESELAKTRDLLELFVQHVPAAIAMFDRKMCYVRTSRKWRAEIGMADVPVLAGRCHYDVIPDMPEEWKVAHRRGLNGEIVKGENSWLRPDGRIVTFRWEVHPWGDTVEITGGILILFENVTELRKMEA